MGRDGDSPLEDTLALDEIELYGELVIAASDSDEPLSQDRIDQVLGVGADAPRGAEAGVPRGSNGNDSGRSGAR